MTKQRHIWLNMVLILAVLAAPMLLAGCNKNKRGLYATYYKNLEWDGPPVKSNIIRDINFIWYSDAEKPLPPPFSMMAEGELKVPEDGEITFTLSSDDGSDLMIDNKLLIDNLGFHIRTEKSAKVRLTKGWHPIRVRYNEYRGGAEFHLYWERPGGQREIIPARFYRPKAGPILDNSQQEEE